MTNTAPAKVSVVMPCYNGRLHLPMSIHSLQSQTFTDWELVVVDDGSSDGSAEWLEHLGDARIRILRQPNRGVSIARNHGLQHCRGELVAFLDTDDTWSSDFLTVMVAAMESNPDAALAYCGWQNVGLPGPAGAPFLPPDYEGPNKEIELFSGCRWPIHAALARRSLLGVGFETDLTHAEDYLMWLSLGARHPLCRVPQVLAQYHFHDGPQASRQHLRAALQLYEAQARYLARHPEFVARTGSRALSAIMLAGLRKRAFERYWARDLDTARPLFRKLMRARHRRLHDWFYLLPSLLPKRVHHWLIDR
jgi:glycosyltransferase involved in cell wall biosynthesis